MSLLRLLLVALVSSSSAATGGSGGSTRDTIAFFSVGRISFGFDLFVAPIGVVLPSAGTPSAAFSGEVRLTDGVSVNYNGAFAGNSSSVIFVSERAGGVPDIYQSQLPSSRRHRETLAVPTPKPLLPAGSGVEAAMRDRPNLAGDYLVYVSTKQPSLRPRQSWAAVYSTHLPSGFTRRLTPPGVADFSSAVSHSGEWTAVASPTNGSWSGEIEELNVSLFLFKTLDGSQRTLVEHHAGWPCWADESTLYFHRRSPDGWWSVYRATIAISGDSVRLVSVVRITSPGFHAFTPAASPALPNVLAIAVHRPGSEYRHIEVVEISAGGESYVEVTRPIEPNKHHFNPFVSPDGALIGYHRCRGRRNGADELPFWESIKSPTPDELSIFRVDGSFPSFSHDGRLMAFSGFGEGGRGLQVVNADGSGGIRTVSAGSSFATAWDWKRKNVIYTSVGPSFAAVTADVDIVSVSFDEEDDGSAEAPVVKKLTAGGMNNAFPSPSPDGKWVVFRSGRTGYKNLYIMDAVAGESAGLRRLTDGPWDDTMCTWSPDGDWIAFTSNRDEGEGGSFSSLYVVHPNGTGLRRVVRSGVGGRATHPWFSPDSKSLVFTTDYAAVSAEPIATTNQFQPYGEIFTVGIDGSNLRRLTHNAYEDGSPTWTPFEVNPFDAAETQQGSGMCDFSDAYWLNTPAAAATVAMTANYATEKKARYC